MHVDCMITISCLVALQTAVATVEHEEEVIFMQLMCIFNSSVPTNTLPTFDRFQGIRRNECNTYVGPPLKEQGVQGHAVRGGQQVHR